MRDMVYVCCCSCCLQFGFGRLSSLHLHTTEVTAVTGTLYGIMIVAVTAFLSIYLFTANLRVAVCCIVLVLCILTGPS